MSIIPESVKWACCFRDSDDDHDEFKLYKDIMGAFDQLEEGTEAQRSSAKRIKTEAEKTRDQISRGGSHIDNFDFGRCCFSLFRKNTYITRGLAESLQRFDIICPNWFSPETKLGYDLIELMGRVEEVRFMFLSKEYIYKDWEQGDDRSVECKFAFTHNEFRDIALIGKGKYMYNYSY